MIAVMLSGCALWPFGKVTVKVNAPKDLVEVKGLAFLGRYSKEAVAEFTIEYKKDEAAALEWTLEGDEEAKPTFEPIEEEGKETGLEITIKLGTKNVTLKGAAPQN